MTYLANFLTYKIQHMVGIITKYLVTKSRYVHNKNVTLSKLSLFTDLIHNLRGSQKWSTKLPSSQLTWQNFSAWQRWNAENLYPCKFMHARNNRGANHSKNRVDFFQRFEDFLDFERFIRLWDFQDFQRFWCVNILRYCKICKNYATFSKHCWKVFWEVLSFVIGNIWDLFRLPKIYEIFLGCLKFQEGY